MATLRTPVALLAIVLAASCSGDSSIPPTPSETSTATVAATEVVVTQALVEATATAAPQPTSTPEPPAPTSTAAPPDGVSSIAIEGTADFVAWTEQALELLRDEAPEWLEQVTASILTIRSVPALSGMDVFNKVYLVGEITAYAPGFTPERQLIWYAGTIVHDSCHSERYDDGLVYLGKEGEVACLMDQKAALLLLDSDPYFSDYVQSLIDGADDPANAYWTNPDRHW